MGMTQAQLLASLGARSVTGDRRGVFLAVEDTAKGVRISGEVFCSERPASVMAQVTYQEAGRAAVRVCGLRADPEGDRYAVTGFAVGGVEYVQDGRWCFFTEADACAFVRAVMLELEANELPDLDALLTFGTAGAMLMSVDWGG